MSAVSVLCFCLRADLDFGQMSFWLNYECNLEVTTFAIVTDQTTQVIY